jgi:hypothetical protein
VDAVIREMLYEEGVKLYRAQGARVELAAINSDVNSEMEWLKAEENKDGKEEESSG